MEIWQRFEKVSRLLDPSVKMKVRKAAPLYRDRALSLQDPHSLHQAAIAALKGRFPVSSPAEMEVLAFYLLCVVAAGKDDSEGRMDSMKEMSEMESLRMQMIMDRRSKLFSTLSNIMKKIANTSETIVQNLK